MAPEILMETGYGLKVSWDVLVNKSFGISMKFYKSFQKFPKLSESLSVKLMHSKKLIEKNILISEKEFLSCLLAAL